jgi:ABC-type transport system substrate-binding protein
MKRRDLLASSGALALVRPTSAGAATAGPGTKTLRFVVPFAETGFDPPRVSDQSSIRVIAHIFEPLLTYDPLAQPAALVPLTAAALPEASADFKRFVFTLQRGILFADDPAFKGQPRELVAADYVYSFKRFYDPTVRTEHLYRLENAKILGLSELRARALKGKTPFPYDVEVPGLRVLDRYRFEILLADPAPRFAHLFTGWMTGAVAREVVEAYADDVMAHPVGTGPFRLAQWRRASRTVLERNPRFREQRFSTLGAPADRPDLQATAQRLAGARAPLLDRIEINVIEEAQPRWLAFLNGEVDLLTLPPTFGPLAMPGGRLAPFLAKRGVQAERVLSATTALTFFNFADPLVGGLTPDKVALRRAVALAFDSAEDVRVVLRDQAVQANQLIPPGCYGHDPALRSELTTPSPARARALLDMHAYVDRNGDGWRETPQGQPLVLRIAFTPTSVSRASSELWLKRLRAVGLRVVFEFAPFGELIKRSLAGQLMMWGFSWSAPDPDGDFYLGLAYGPNADQSNDARFALPAYDRVYEQQRALADGPERLALMHQANKLMLAYMPYMAHNHAIVTDLLQPGVRGPLRHPFNSDWFRWADVGVPADAGRASAHPL